MVSSSEDEAQVENKWQKVRNTKKREISINQGNKNSDISLSNTYSSLNVEENTSQSNTANTISKPPPIFIYGVVNFSEMVNKLREIKDDEQYGRQ